MNNDNNDNVDYIVHLGNNKDDNLNIHIETERRANKNQISARSFSDEEIKKYKYILDSFKTMRKLKSVLTQLDGKDPEEEERLYFSSFKCNTEREKLLFELDFVISELAKHTDEQEDYAKITIKLLEAMKNGISKKTYLDADYIKNVKQALLSTEIEFDIPVSFYSEVESLYHKKLNQNVENVKSKKV